jgi:hypothetical protein
MIRVDAQPLATSVVKVLFAAQRAHLFRVDHAVCDHPASVCHPDASVAVALGD